MLKKAKVTIDDLAIMIAKGFSGMEEKFEKDIGGVKKEVGSLKKEVGSLRKEVAETNVRLDVLENGQEDIMMKLQNVAYRFELNTLDKRVKILENVSTRKI